MELTTARRIATTALALIAASLALTSVAFAARFDADKISFLDVTADVRVTTNEGDAIDVVVRQGKVYSEVSVLHMGDTVIVQGVKWQDDENRDCCDQRIRRTANLRKDRTQPREETLGDAFFADYPVIEVTMPRRTDVTFADARIRLEMERLDGSLNLQSCYVYGETGSLGEAVVGVIDGSRFVMGDIGGMLELDVSGAAAVRAGKAAMADIDIAGPGDVALGAIDGMLDVSIAGSGFVRSSRADGPVTVRIAGSGEVAVQAGKADPLKATIDGSGAIYFQGTANNPDLRLFGSSEVHLDRIRGRLTHKGGGTVFNGDDVVSD
ncbi:MAG: DUF2807 domain-containing protein [Pseudomonadota bacterium]